MKKYICVGGTVISKGDFQPHWVSAQRVTELYGLQHHQCILASDRVHLKELLIGIDRESVVLLYADPTGEYKL